MIDIARSTRDPNFSIETRMPYRWNGLRYERTGTLNTITCKRCGTVAKETLTPVGKLPQLYCNEMFDGIKCQKCDVETIR